MKNRDNRYRIKIKKLKDADNRMYDNCPTCGWDAPNFDGTYYKIDGINIKFDLSIMDIDETGQNIPSEYYPKVSNYRAMTPIQGMFVGHQWEEIHMCPLCNKEFSFINSK